MNLLKRVPPLNVKRAFVAADKLKLSRRKGTKFLPKLARSQFLSKLSHSKYSTNKLSQKQLDDIVAEGSKGRLKAYNNSNWWLASAKINELGVWRQAGGLPSAWTCCSLEQTAAYVKKAIKNNSKRMRARSKRAIPRIMDFADIISSDEYLFPIVFEGGTGTKGRTWCLKKMAGDIDDGSMRAIALVLSGYKTLNIYLGKPKASKRPKLV